MVSQRENGNDTWRLLETKMLKTANAENRAPGISDLWVGTGCTENVEHYYHSSEGQQQASGEGQRGR
jgi:hypothetical protein